jgi:hypothetical protein
MVPEASWLSAQTTPFSSRFIAISIGHFLILWCFAASWREPLSGPDTLVSQPTAEPRLGVIDAYHLACQPDD